MTKAEANSQIKATVLGLEYNPDRSQMKLLEKVKSKDHKIQLSAFVRILQKDSYNDEVYLTLVNFSNDSCSTLKVSPLELNPEAQQEKEDGPTLCDDGLKLKADEYPIVQDFRFNLKNVPLNEKGQYAFAIIAVEGDLDSLIDAYYFTVE